VAGVGIVKLMGAGGFFTNPATKMEHLGGQMLVKQAEMDGNPHPLSEIEPTVKRWVQ